MTHPSQSPTSRCRGSCLDKVQSEKAMEGIGTIGSSSQSPVQPGGSSSREILSFDEQLQNLSDDNRATTPDQKRPESPGSFSSRQRSSSLDSLPKETGLGKNMNDPGMLTSDEDKTRSSTPSLGPRRSSSLESLPKETGLGTNMNDPGLMTSDEDRTRSSTPSLGPRRSSSLESLPKETGLGTNMKDPGLMTSDEDKSRKSTPIPGRRRSFSPFLANDFELGEETIKTSGKMSPPGRARSSSLESQVKDFGFGEEMSNDPGMMATEEDKSSNSRPMSSAGDQSNSQGPPRANMSFFEKLQKLTDEGTGQSDRKRRRSLSPRSEDMSFFEKLQKLTEEGTAPSDRQRGSLSPKTRKRRRRAVRPPAIEEITARKAIVNPRSLPKCMIGVAYNKPVGNFFGEGKRWEVMLNLDAGRYGQPSLGLKFRFFKNAWSEPGSDKPGLFDREFQIDWFPGISIHGKHMMVDFKAGSVLEATATQSNFLAPSELDVANWSANDRRRLMYVTFGSHGYAFTQGDGRIQRKNLDPEDEHALSQMFPHPTAKLRMVIWFMVPTPDVETFEDQCMSYFRKAARLHQPRQNRYVEQNGRPLLYYNTKTKCLMSIKGRFKLARSPDTLLRSRHARSPETSSEGSPRDTEMNRADTDQSKTTAPDYIEDHSEIIAPPSIAYHSGSEEGEICEDAEE